MPGMQVNMNAPLSNTDMSFTSTGNTSTAGMNINMELNGNQ